MGCGCTGKSCGGGGASRCGCGGSAPTAKGGQLDTPALATLQAPQQTGLLHDVDPITERYGPAVRPLIAPSDTSRPRMLELRTPAETAPWCGDGTSGQPDGILRVGHRGTTLAARPTPRRRTCLMLPAVGELPVDGGDPTLPAQRLLARRGTPGNRETPDGLLRAPFSVESPRPGRGGSRHPEELFSPGAAAIKVPLRMRAVEVSVDAVWLDEWTDEWGSLDDPNGAGDLVGSVADTLAEVWPEYTAALATMSGLDDDTIDSALGCFSLAPTADRALFYRTGWGPAREAWRTMARLAVVYADDIRDEWMDPSTVGVGPSAIEFSYCEGFGDFVRDVLRGRSKPNRFGEYNCKRRINFDGYDPRFWFEADGDRYVVGHADARCEGTPDRLCGRYFNRSSPSNPPYDAELSYWEDHGWRGDYRAWARQGRTPPSLTGESDRSLVGIAGPAQLTLHPNQLQWLGFVSDRALHLARMVSDWARHIDVRGGPRGGPRALAAVLAREQARQLGRYALGPIVDLGSTMVHELGHVWIGKSGHCPFKCCFDVASERWRWSVQQRLGMPRDGWSSGRFTPGGTDPGSVYRLETDHHVSTLNITHEGGTCGWGLSFEPVRVPTRVRLHGYYDMSVNYWWGKPRGPAAFCFDNGRRAESASSEVSVPWSSHGCDGAALLPRPDGKAELPRPNSPSRLPHGIPLSRT